MIGKTSSLLSSDMAALQVVVCLISPWRLLKVLPLVHFVTVGVTSYKPVIELCGCLRCFRVLRRRLGNQNCSTLVVSRYGVTFRKWPPPNGGSSPIALTSTNRHLFRHVRIAFECHSSSCDGNFRVTRQLFIFKIFLSGFF